MAKRIRIIFIGTPEFAVPALEKLIANPSTTLGAGRYSLIAVITEPDRPKGRGRILTPPPIKAVAQKHKIPVFQPIRISLIAYRLSQLNPALIIVCAYGQIIPQEILNIPKFGALNIHPSLLPKYRGVTPIQAAILNGDKETGVTIIKMDEKLDHGPIVRSAKCEVRNGIIYPELGEKLSNLGAKLLLDTLPLYLSGKIKPKPQNHSKATYAKLLKKEDGLIDWKKGPKQIERQIRAFYPWPGSYFVASGKRFIIHQGCLENDKLVIAQIQPEGKKIMTGKEFSRGYPQALTKFPKYVKI